MENKATFHHVVTAEEDGAMLQQVLKNRFRFSRRFLRKLRGNRLVTVNGEFRFFSSRVAEGDRIEVHLPVDETAHIPPEPVEFGVIYEDDDLIVIDKPPGLVVHPTRGHLSGTLANGLMHYWAERGESHAMRPVTRLDKDTSGLLVVAKHAYTHAFLAAQMAEKRYRRVYLAVVHGRVEKESGRIDMPIGLDEDSKIYRIVKEGGAPAVTRFEVVERFCDATLLRLELETGRTHQIRVHLSHLGHPIIGDDLYGDGNDRHLIPRQALHASYLCLFHPRKREWMEWEAPLPQDMSRLLSLLRANE
jgi:23S rRNA pseudouridine1911/1915/1917 synthase